MGEAIMKFISFVIILIFSCLWTAITNKYLPSETIANGSQQDPYDERQRKIFIEILAKSFIWVVYCMLLLLLLKFIGLSPNVENLWYSKYPEVYFLIVSLLILAFNYFTTKRKYSSKS